MSAIQQPSKSVTAEETAGESKARIVRGPPSPLPSTNIQANDPKWREQLCLNWVPKETDDFLKDILRITMKRLAKKTIPPKGVWVSESPETTELYKKYFKKRCLKDDRISRRYLDEVDPKEWRHVVRLGESAIIVDEDTGKEELIVI